MTSFNQTKKKSCDNCNLQFNKLQSDICRLCHMISNIRPQYVNELIVCYSHYEQIKIIRDTINYILKYKKNPLPTEIDPDVMLSNCPLHRYNNDMVNHKIFITNLFNHTSIIKHSFCDGLYTVSEYYSPKRFLYDDKILNLKKISPDNELIISELNNKDKNIHNDIIFNIDDDNIMNKYFNDELNIKIIRTNLKYNALINESEII